MTMTAEEFRAFGLSLYGYGWQSALARALGMSVRHVQRLAAGKSDVTPELEKELRALTGANDPDMLDVMRPRDEWILGDGPPDSKTGERREYIFHARFPRFVARVVRLLDPDDATSVDPAEGETDPLSGVTCQAAPDSLLCEIAWIDRPPGPAELSRLMEAASDALEHASA